MTTQTKLQQQIAITLLPNFGSKRIRAILNELDSVENFFKEKKQILKTIPRIGENLIRQLNRDLALKQAESYVEYLLKNKNFNSHFFDEPTFPRRLNECEDAPLMLYSCGNMDLNPKKTLAIVGTRNATNYGKAICEELITCLATKKCLIVSGLAYGIDIHVHQLCIKNNLQTVGVLGHGLDLIYPSYHKKTAEEMLKFGGLLTEYLPGTNPDRENFPMRNRIVAGMADATIVVESGAKGGSLITAELANDYNREVFAFPGDITRPFSKGCNNLIKNNKAHLVSSCSDILKIMNWENEENKVKPINLDLFSNLNEIEKKIISCFKEKVELSYDFLIQQTKITFSELSSNLLNLEFAGVLKTNPGKKYQLLMNHK